MGEIHSGATPPEKNFENRARSMARCRGNGEFGRGWGRKKKKKSGGKEKIFFLLEKIFL